LAVETGGIDQESTKKRIMVAASKVTEDEDLNDTPS
jgi:hypothetical protein